MCTNCNHSDCANFIPIDVAKGICHANGDIVVQVDTETCLKFTPRRKCKFCSHLSNVDDRGMGTCEGFPVNDWAFAENGAQNCEMFEMAGKAEKVAVS